jgi:hypothetical protein
LNINVEVNYGELTACEFVIKDPNKVDAVVYTSYHSKDDPSNTVFALDDESLESFCNYINRWDSAFNINRKDLNFMDEYDNYYLDNERFIQAGNGGKQRNKKDGRWLIYTASFYIIEKFC